MSESLNYEHYPFDPQQLPCGWAVTSINSVATDIESGFPSGEHNEEGRGVPHLRPMNIDRQGRIDLTKLKFVDIPSPKTVRHGDVLFNNTNSPELIGKTSVINSEAQLAFSNHMTRIEVNSNADPRFVAAQLHFLWMTGYFKHRCVNHVNQASISTDPLSNTVPLLIAPSNEQQRIADALDELLSDLDAGVEALQRAQAKLALYRASVLKAAVQGDLTAEWRNQHPDAEPASVLLQRILVERRQRWEQEQLRKFKAAGKTPPANWKAKYKEPVAPDTTNLPPLPEGWCWATMEQVCGFITKGTTPSGPEAPKESGDIPFLKVQHLSAVGKFHFADSPAFVSETVHSGFLARSKVYPGDVLMNIVGPPLGQVAIVPDNWPVWNVNQAIAIFRCVPGVLNHYLATCLSTDSLLVRALKRAKTTAGQVNLTLEICRELPIPLPPTAEQEGMAELIDDQTSMLDHLDEDIQKKVVTSIPFRQSILRHAFTGQLVPQDPKDEPASELLKRITAEREARKKTKATPRKQTAKRQKREK